MRKLWGFFKAWLFVLNSMLPTLALSVDLCFNCFIFLPLEEIKPHTLKKTTQDGFRELRCFNLFPNPCVALHKQNC